MHKHVHVCARERRRNQGVCVCVSCSQCDNVVVCTQGPGVCVCVSCSLSLLDSVVVCTQGPGSEMRDLPFTQVHQPIVMQPPIAYRCVYSLALVQAITFSSSSSSHSSDGNFSLYDEGSSVLQDLQTAVALVSHWMWSGQIPFLRGSFRGQDCCCCLLFA